MKLQFLDELCEHHFDASVIEKEWQPLRTPLRESIDFRNTLAHFEINCVRDLKFVSEGDPPALLTPHHMDLRARDKPMVRAINLSGLKQMAENSRAVTNSSIALVRRHLSLETLLATHLPATLAAIPRDRSNSVSSTSPAARIISGVMAKEQRL